MPKAKLFSHKKSRPDQIYSEDRERITQFEQSRYGRDLEKMRIDTRFRTRLTRAKQKLAATPRITQKEMEVQLEAQRQQLNAQRDEEMREMEDAWMKLTETGDSKYMDREEEEYEESADDVQEKNDSDEGDSEDEFLDADAGDVSSDEEIYDEEGNTRPTATQALDTNLQSIYKRHREKMDSVLTKYEKIEHHLADEEGDEENEVEWETDSDWKADIVEDASYCEEFTSKCVRSARHLQKSTWDRKI